MVGPAVDAAAGGTGVRHARPHQRAPLPRLSRESVRLLRFGFALDVHSHAARVQPLAGWQGRAGCSRRSSGGGGGGGDPLRAFTRQRTTALARSRRGARPRRKAGRALRRRSKEPDRWPRDGADGATPRPRTAMGAVLIPSTAGARRCQETRLKPALVAAGSSRRGFPPGRSTGLSIGSRWLVARAVMDPSPLVPVTLVGLELFIYWEKRPLCRSKQSLVSRSHSVYGPAAERTITGDSFLRCRPLTSRRLRQPLRGHRIPIPRTWECPA